MRHQAMDLDGGSVALHGIQKYFKVFLVNVQANLKGLNEHYEC